jgi:Na+/H+-dicarboxylate symporter
MIFSPNLGVILKNNPGNIRPVVIFSACLGVSCLAYLTLRRAVKLHHYKNPK